MAALFADWKLLRQCDAALVCARRERVLPSLEQMLGCDRPRVRRTGALALRSFYEPTADDAALRALGDADPSVRDAARESVRVLIDPPDGDPRAWWESLAERERAGILEKQFNRR
jgi:hypothetical protein